ncbi:hypothetical protein C2G38_963448 [Gigaspora rosea]|uniref:Uncharacterized protein n=1 Tax=Gigaspora rosea TaxID=44941 RepID=A0A397VLB9_9GLOM|nr:hypothetical protein C2G38_963448 [Gigaspora rosea]
MIQAHNIQFILMKKKKFYFLLENVRFKFGAIMLKKELLNSLVFFVMRMMRLRSKKIEYAIRKFKLSIQINRKDSNSIFEIEMGDDIYDNVIKAAKEACNALIYLNKWSQMPNYGYAVPFAKINEIVKQTRNIIVRFIQLYPIVWRLLDFRFNLVSILIKANEHTLIKYILFDEKKEETLVDDSENHILKTLDCIVSEMKIKKPSDLDSLLHEKSLHMPKCSSWEGKENEHALSVALSVDDPIFLGFLLEYYSNKATKEIGWMITVTDIIPRLYSENNKNSEVYKSYAQILFYKSCFCQKELDISSFEFLEIPPSMENSLKVFIPVTQLIPQNSVLEAKMLSQYIIPNILMVPLIDFTTTKINKKSSLDVKKEDKFTNFLKFLKSKFYPGKYAHQEGYYSPFLKLIEKIESNDPFYYNPSMEATMNVMWYLCKSHFHKKLYIYLLFFNLFDYFLDVYCTHSSCWRISTCSNGYNLSIIFLFNLLSNCG